MTENKISTINKKIWNMAGVLMDEGVSNSDYLEQLTYLLFLKMMDEYSKPPYNKNMNIPKECRWDTLLNKKGDELAKKYKYILETLAQEPGILKEIYGQAQNKIQTPGRLAKVIKMVDDEKWTSMSSDVKGDIYEGLLQKIAEDTKSGAGQYFTPRPVINTMVKCIAPEPNKTICDPCCGSGGFLLMSKKYIEEHYNLNREQKNFLKYETFRGWEIVQSTYRLCLMNLFLHNISDIDGNSPITRNDALLADPGERFDYVLTNPPFGKKSAITYTNEKGEKQKEELVYNRQDFWTTSSNKQFNFLQHIYTLLNENGKAAVVLPDNVLFEKESGGLTIRKKLLEKTNLHTILRLPTGIFYKPGVKANILFFDNKPTRREVQTKEVWIYDARAGMNFTLKQHPLTEEDLAEFVELYRAKNRKETYSKENPNGRWRKYTYQEIVDNNFNLNLKWMNEKEELEDIKIEDLFKNIRTESKNISKTVDKLENVLKKPNYTVRTTKKVENSLKEFTNTKSHYEKMLESIQLLKKKIIEEIINDFDKKIFKEVYLGELLIYEQPTNYIVKSTQYSDSYKTPVLTAGKSFLLGYTNEEDGVFKEDLPVIIFDDFTTASKFVDFEFKVKSSAMKILHCKEKNDPKYLYYLLQTITVDNTTHKRYWISEFENYKVVVPNLKRQKELTRRIENALKLLNKI